MTATTFDTLAIAKRLKSRGLTEEQAEAIAVELKEAREHDLDSLVTRRDLQELELRLTVKLGMIVGGIIGFFQIMEKFF